MRHEIDAMGNAGILAGRAGAKETNLYLPEVSFGDNQAVPNGIFAEVGRPKHTAGGADNEIVAKFAGFGGPKDQNLKVDTSDCFNNRLKNPPVMSKRTDIPWVPFL